MRHLIKMLVPVLCAVLVSTPVVWADEEIELLQPQVYDLGGEPAPPPKIKKPAPKPKPRPEAEKFVVSPPPPPPPPPPPQYDPPPRRPTPPPPPPRVASAEDNHFIQGDDYFIQRHGLEGHTWIYVELAKMVTNPGAHTKGEAEFMKVRDGKNYWTGHYWQTRIVSQSELRLGLPVIIFEGNHRNSIYSAPKSKDNARGHSWFMAKITDMSDTYKGYVTVSGNYKVSLDNMRVVVP